MTGPSPRSMIPAFKAGSDTAPPVAAETGYREVIPGLSVHQEAYGSPKTPFPQFSRLIDICCIAEMLRNFPLTSLDDEETKRFLELQSFFFSLESKCLDEAGFE